MDIIQKKISGGSLLSENNNVLQNPTVSSLGGNMAPYTSKAIGGGKKRRTKKKRSMKRRRIASKKNKKNKKTCLWKFW